MYGPPQSLEDCLKDMVAILAMQQIDMQGNSGMLTKGAEEFLAETAVKGPDLLIGKDYLIMKEWSIRQIDYHLHQGLIHRHQTATVAIDPCLAAEGLGKGLAKTDADIFDGMVIVYFNISLGRKVQVKKTMHGKEGEHMIEKGDSRINNRLALPIYGKIKTNVGLACLSFNTRRSIVL